MTFLELAEKVLREERIPLTASEIWKVAENNGYTSNLNSQGKTPWATLGAQIYVNERDNKKTIFAVVGKRPKRFYLKEQAYLFDLEKIEITENTGEIAKNKNATSYLEKHLHPFLAHFAYFHLKCHIKTINHSKSTKKEYGEWVHPDIVGCNFLIGDWSTEVSEIISNKKEAKKTYKYNQGYMPMVGHIAEINHVIQTDFREGNIAPKTENLEFIKKYMSNLPKGVKLKNLRIDCAGYQKSIIKYCDEKEIHFAIRAIKSKSLTSYIEGVN